MACFLKNKTLSARCLAFMSLLMIVASACMIGHGKSQSRVIDELLSLTISNYIDAKTKNLSSAAVDWGLWSEVMSYVKGEEIDFFFNNLTKALCHLPSLW